MDEIQSAGSSRTPGGPTGKKHRYAVDDDEEDQVECSGRSCRSCTAGMVADCVALCCCPCAVVNFLTLAFLKVPWMVGRRCLGRIGKKKNRRKLEKKRKWESSSSSNDGCMVVGGNVISRKELEMEIGALEIESSSCGFGEEELKDNYSARFEAEKVWLELYQVGHLGFGRVSFNGIQSLGKG